MPSGVRVRVPPGLPADLACCNRENGYIAAEPTGIAALIGGQLQTDCKRLVRLACPGTPMRRSPGQLLSSDLARRPLGCTPAVGRSGRPTAHSPLAPRRASPLGEHCPYDRHHTTTSPAQSVTMIAPISHSVQPRSLTARRRPLPPWCRAPWHGRRAWGRAGYGNNGTFISVLIH